MAFEAGTITFKTSDLANLYVNGTGLAAGSGSNSSEDELQKFRSGYISGVGTPDAALTAILDDVKSLDNRIVNFQNAITARAPAGTEDKPYDAAMMKREFMEEVFALLIRRGDFRANSPTYTVNTGDGNEDLLGDGLRNLSDKTFDDMRGYLVEGGKRIFNSYAALIDAIFTEGNKMANNPTDPATGLAVSTNITTTIPDTDIGGVIYNRVTSERIPGANDPDDTKNFNYFLIQKNSTPVVSGKTNLEGYAVDRASNSVSTTRPVVDTQLTFGGGLVTTNYLRVNKNLTAISGEVPQPRLSRQMSPMWFLYYWNEARVKVLRGQLNYKEAVTAEIRDDLAKANKAYSDLERQAGRTRSQSADGKTMNPDLSYETATMDFFEATNTKAGATLFDNGGSDDLQNFSTWGSSRSSLKTYIDAKSTHSQDAMLDYQTTLNRYNNAFEVMSKLQEKIDGLVKSQLRNVA
jgi:hypothetical protein